MITNLNRVARKNRNYYLSEKKADNSTNRWFRYIKTMDSYSEPVMVSPSMAKELLDSYDEAFDLRMPVDMNKVQDIADELKRLSHKTVSISFSGKLLDGRLALHAILMNKKSAVVFISFNISDKLSFLFG